MTEKTYPLPCPNCQQVRLCVEPIRLVRKIPILWYLAGGVIYAFLFVGSRRKTFRCTTCDRAFRAHTDATVAMLVIFVLMLIPLVVGLVGLAINLMGVL